MAVYDTYKPFTIGNQFAPLLEGSTVLDIGAEIGYQFIATEPFSGLTGASWVRIVTNVPPPGVSSGEIVCRLYNGDPISTCGPIQKVIIPCSAGYGGALGGGAATHAIATANPSDPYYVRLTGASALAKFWFGTNRAVYAAALDTWDTEIVDVSVVYCVSGPFSSATTNTVSLGLEREGDSVKRYMDYLVTGPSLSSSITALRRSRLGELNPFWDTAINPNTEPMRGPWVYRATDDSGLYAFNTSSIDDITVFFETGASAAGDFDIHYVGLEVSYRSRQGMVGIGGMNLSGGVEISEGIYTYRCPIMPADLPWDWSGGTVSFGLTMGERYTLTVSRAYSGSRSLSSPVPLPISFLDTVDQSVPNLTGVQITKPIALGATPTYSETTRLPAIVMYAASPTLWATEMDAAHVNSASHAYKKLAIQQVHDTGSYYAVQQIPNNVAGTFAWVTFYARARDAVNGSLYVSQTAGGVFAGPEATISYDDWFALPEITDGWRKVTVPIVPPVVLTGLGGLSYWRFWANSDDLLLWEIVGATSNETVTASGASAGAMAGYYGQTAISSFTGSSNYTVDLAITLSQAMTVVSSFAVTQQLQALEVVDEYCLVDIDTIPTGIVYNHLSWDAVLSGMVSAWGYYEIQRRDTTMDVGVWETIAKITNPYVEEMDDYEARIGVESTYRIRTVNMVGVESAWAASVASTLLVPGVTGSGCGTGLLVLTSNESPASNLAYVHIHGTGDSEDFTFIEESQQTFEPMFRRDYQMALRPTERGGVTFDRTILVNKVGVPVGTLDRGFTSLRDLAWDSIPYVCVRDELANRWLANVGVPSGSVRRHDLKASYYQVAQVTVTEVTGTPQALDIEEPYLGLTSSRNSDVAAWASPLTSLATLEDVDVQMKIIVRAPDWVVTMYRHDVGPPESIWSFYASSEDGAEVGFDSIGDDGFFFKNVNTIIPILNQPIWVRAVYDHDAGGGLTSTAKFYSSLDGVSWTSYGTFADGPAGLVPSAGGTLSLFPSKNVVLQELIMINTTTNTTIMCPNFAAQTTTTTTFVDACGVTWDIQAW